MFITFPSRRRFLKSMAAGTCWAVCGAVRRSPAQAAEAPPATATLLFAGSSSTYWNDLPREVARRIDGQVAGLPGTKIVPEIVGRSGDDIRVYSEPGFVRYEYGVKSGQTFLEKIRDEKPRFVVLQTVCRFIVDEKNVTAEGKNAHAAAVEKYCAAVREAGGEPVFYEMGWGRGELEAAGRKRIFELAKRLGVRRYVPCSTAWERVRTERPELALQHPADGAHPGDLGHFLNVACFHAVLTERSPVGVLPRRFPVWPHAMKKPTDPAEQAAEATLLENFRPDEYQARLPKWMHRNMARQAVAEVDDSTARYLETVADETVRDLRTRLRRADR